MTASIKKRSPWRLFVIVLSLVLIFGGAAMGAAVYLMREADWGTGTTDGSGQKEAGIRQTAQGNPGGLLAAVSEGGSVLDNMQPEFAGEETSAKPAGRYGALLADQERMKAENCYGIEGAFGDRITLAFAGDILFDPQYAVMAKLKQRGGRIEDGICEELLTRMRSADIFMVNNEFTYTDGGTPTEGKQYTFRAPRESVSYLEDMGADVVSLANNHVYDYGERSLIDTLTTLENSGIPYVGAGRNLQEASRPVSFIVNDTRITILSATQIERQDHPDTKGATESAAGTFRCFNPDRLLEAVTQARQDSDYVIVYIHWGTENTTEIDWAQRDQAKLIAEAGADLIVGDHPHCLQPLAYVGDVPVIYSLGNFWFNSRQVDTCLLEVEIPSAALTVQDSQEPAGASDRTDLADASADTSSNRGLTVRIVPAIQKDCYTSQLHDAERMRVIDYLNGISDNAYLDEDGVMCRKN